MALGVSGAAVILIEGLGIMSVPTNAYNGVAKYPLLALPVFILAGMMFERAGVALRIVRFAVGHRRPPPRRAGHRRHPGLHVPGRHHPAPGRPTRPRWRW